ncbi:uncharacterized protein I206_102188 [Kwoniella pini CBS 10737]|uniref:Zn(2)-C6 fungal-type domain-containing protein n=1 Tax=Kwoniella pini CBS 10737 TaxID=1296096 RepID=A0A1B9HUJ9_9TREE|nr:uncharacterized protein I206_06719 [Kwoniella pini CBS 10737]OCF46945.1 hypothetical protein I206_06719 [Kwoniella pini CBS 10737]
MQRHYSDTAYLPQRSSRLNPNPNTVVCRPSRGVPVGIIQQRGTMSMPTSPTMSKMLFQTTGVDATSQDTLHTPQTAQPSSSLQAQQESTSQHGHSISNGPSLQQQYQQGPISHISPMDMFSPPSLGYSETPIYQSQPQASSSSIQHISPHPVTFPNITGQGSFNASLSRLEPPVFNTDNADFQINNNGISHIDQMRNFRNQQNCDGFHQIHQEHSDWEMDTDINFGPGGRKKRNQVRIACTHCQKACKKCSNKRPCERCVKYGLSDCVDSARKPRRTGMKRGPYKRRSSKYSESEYHLPSTLKSHVNASAPSNSNLDVKCPESAVVNFTTGNRNHQAHSQLSMTKNVAYFSPGRSYLLQNPTQTNSDKLTSEPPQNMISQNTDQVPKASEAVDKFTNNNDDPGHTNKVYPPFPKGNNQHNLVLALSNALSNPQSQQWINGKRLPLNSNSNSNNSNSITNENENGNGKKGKTSPLYPKTPIGPFPFSLKTKGKDDPFSRSVSPIKQFNSEFGFGIGFEFQQNSNFNNNNNNQEKRNELLNDVREESEISDESFSSEISNNQFIKQFNDDQNNQLQNKFQYQLPNKIHKPSLKTLISTTTSKVPTPSPITFTTTNTNTKIDIQMQSPTLFQGGMLDENDVNLANWKEWENNHIQKNDTIQTNMRDDCQEDKDKNKGSEHIDGVSFEGLMGLH